MERLLQLEKGEIVLSNDKITIRDKAKREHLRSIVSSAAWALFGIVSVLRYLQTGDQFLLWTGLIIGAGHLIGLAYILLRTTRSEISLQEVVAAIFKERNGNRFLDLKLSSGKKRRISRVAPATEELRAFFTEKQIQVK